MINITAKQLQHHRECHCKDCELSKLRFALYKLLEYLVIFLIGGATYVCIELLYRGYSHWSMFIVGGLCLIIIGILNEGIFPRQCGLLLQMIIGAIAITCIEFITGIIVNVWLGLDVWDYSNMPLNIMGQVCLPFTLAWFLLSYVAIRVDDEIRYRLFNEPKPTYVWWTFKEKD